MVVFLSVSKKTDACEDNLPKSWIFVGWCSAGSLAQSLPNREGFPPVKDSFRKLRT